MELKDLVNQTEYMGIGNPLDNEKLLNTQKKLHVENLPAIPQDFIAFLKEFNGLSYSDGNIYGVYPATTSCKDIYKQNISRPIDSDSLILGHDIFDLLIYNNQNSLYQIVDSNDLEVLEEYTELEDAILHILKI